MIPTKKISVSLSNYTPYVLTFKENALKWGRIIERADSVEPNTITSLLVANKNNTQIIEGTLTYSVGAPLKQIELVIELGVSQGQPFVASAFITQEGRRVDNVKISDKTKLDVSENIPATEEKDEEGNDNYQVGFVLATKTYG